MVRNGARGIALAAAAAACGLAALAGPAVGAQLPDGRSYEMVSPPEKNGSDVITQTAKTHVAQDGRAVTFSALGGFGSLRVAGFDSQYVARRTGAPGTNGWSTQGMNPLGGAQTLAAIAIAGQGPTFLNGFTPDLSAGIYYSWRPLTDAPNVRDIANLYRVTGLGSGNPVPQLLSNAVAPLALPPLFTLFVRPIPAGASTDLRTVVFESQVPLTADEPLQSPLAQKRLYENANGVVRLVGRVPADPNDAECDDVAGPACVAADTSQAGIAASTFYSQRMVSADGRRILFQVPAGAESGAIYLREDGVRTVRLAQDGRLWDASRDGSRIFFTTSEGLDADDETDDGTPADVDGFDDLYMYDADAAAGDRLTFVSAGSESDGLVLVVVGASDDGRYVYFMADGQLVAGEPGGANGLYVWHDGSLAFIGQWVGGDEGERNGLRTVWLFASTAKASRVTPDGRHLLFMARDDAGFRGRGGYAGYDHAGHRELYLYSADTGRLACASCNPSGVPATADAVTEVRINTATSQTTPKLNQALSDDGGRVFFSTAEALVEDDVNGVEDAYEYDAASGTVHLISSGTDPSPSYFMDASRSGDDVFFATRQPLLRWDVDDVYDLYDARVGGGFPEPVPVVAPCTGEACLPAAGGTPVGPVVSNAFRGAGDVRARLRRHRRRCRGRAVRRHVRGRVRCVKRRGPRGQRTRARDERSGR